MKSHHTTVIGLALLIPLTVCGAPAGAEALPSFKDPSEQVSGWYHRHEIETWVTKGADTEVVEGILERIATSEGERSDPARIDGVTAFGPGNWIYEWSSAGHRTMQTARALESDGDIDAAREGYLEALAYFTTASWPHLGNPDDRAALASARTAYMAAGQLLSRPVQHVSFPVGADSSRGYLHLPPGPGPYPLVILTFGSDVTKEDGFGFFTAELERRGIALLLVDLPGIGESSHIALLEGSDAVLGAAVDFAATRPEIRAEQIFLVGASFGGNAAARAFLNDRINGRVAGVVSMCGPLHSPFMAPPEVFDQLPELTIDGVKARLGILGESNKRLAEIAPGLSLKIQGMFDRTVTIDTPLLVFTTNRDPVAPLDDLPALLASASQAETLVLDMIGHCPPRWARQPVVARWVADRIAEQ